MMWRSPGVVSVCSYFSFLISHFSFLFSLYSLPYEFSLPDKTMPMVASFCMAPALCPLARLVAGEGKRRGGCDFVSQPP
jgi:hypothetical protein